ncbi:MAG: polyprenyl synthetase family protein [Spirochaetota bacterium]
MTTFWKREPDIAEGLETVADLIFHQAAGASPYIASYLERMFASQGKMLRPALVLIGARFGALSGSKKVYDQAALIEMIHIASLIHDDIIDSATSRRGRPTLYKELGARRAVITGDFVLSRALALIASDQDGTEPTAAVSRAFCRLCNGEIDQDSEEWNFFISRSHYLRRIAGKTAAMFALSGYLGANTAGADPFIQYQLHQIGYNIGMAFQIQDDVLDMTGNQEDLGKPVGRDLRSGVCTLPVIYALEADSTGYLAHKLKGRKSISQRKAQKLIDRITELGGIERAKETAWFYSDRALSLIDSLPDQDTSAVLTRMMERLHIRNH